MPDRKLPRVEREMAWHAHLVLATRTPFLSTTPGADPDCLVGESLYDSRAVHSALHRLAVSVTPESPLAPALLPAVVAAGRLLSLRSSWIDYCNERFSLDPLAQDVTSEMSRQYVAGDVVHAWPDFDQGKAAYEEAEAALMAFQPVLARFCGVDSGSTSAVTKGGSAHPWLRMVSGIRGKR
ncbi:hypothetical protein [Streptomyces sp. NPDC048650]|uniref:hypothetical protein n=1 Tax=Streptomyces sp. NPDC048650 TaxID=3365583 RepID=UPI00370FB100